VLKTLLAEPRRLEGRDRNRRSQHDLRKLKKLIDLVEEWDCRVGSHEARKNQDRQRRPKRKGVVILPASAPAGPPAAQALSVAAAPAAPAAAPAARNNPNVARRPYRQVAHGRHFLPGGLPGAKPFVEVGDTVEAADHLRHRGDEADEEIEADKNGVIRQSCRERPAVEYGES